MTNYSYVGENIYVVRGSEQGGLATYSNYKSALAHAKHFVGDALQVEKSRLSPHMTFVYGKWSDAVIEVYPLKEEFEEKNDE